MMCALLFLGLGIRLAVLGTNVGAIYNGLLVPISLNSLLLYVLCKLCKQFSVLPYVYGSYAAIDGKRGKIACRLANVPLYGVETVAAVC